MEYAKATPDDILIQITVVNRGPAAKPLTVLPTLWFRNTWSWAENSPKPQIKLADRQADFSTLAASHPDFGPHYLYCQHITADGDNSILFTENETNNQALFGADNTTPYVKDAFHRYVIAGDTAAVNPEAIGTKAAAHYHQDLRIDKITKTIIQAVLPISGAWRMNCRAAS